MKKSILSFILAGAVLTLTGCCWDGGCAGYVQPVSCCNTCTTCNTCGTCGYGYGYNDWY